MNTDYNLPQEEVDQYLDYGLIEICDWCHYYYGFKNWHDDTNFIECVGTEFLCKKCKQIYDKCQTT